MVKVKYSWHFIVEQKNSLSLICLENRKMHFKEVSITHCAPTISDYEFKKSLIEMGMQRFNPIWQSFCLPLLALKNPYTHLFSIIWGDAHGPKFLIIHKSFRSDLMNFSWLCRALTMLINFDAFLMVFPEIMWGTFSSD